MQGIRKAAESLAASTEKAAGGFSSRKEDPSMPLDKAVQVTDLLKSVRTVFREVAAGPEPAQQPAPSETLEQSSAAVDDSATAVAVKGEEAQPALLQHINFFAEHEARESHPEVHPSSFACCVLF